MEPPEERRPQENSRGDFPDDRRLAQPPGRRRAEAGGRGDGQNLEREKGEFSPSRPEGRGVHGCGVGVTEL